MAQDATDRPRFRIVVIEDDSEVRSLIEVMAEVDGRFDLVGVADDGDVGVDLVCRLRPDAAVLDLQLHGLDGVAAIPLLRAGSPDSQIVVFSAFPDPFTLFDVLSLGAAAYLDKATAWAELLPTIAAVCAEAGSGATAPPPASAPEGPRRFPGSPVSPVQTPR